LGELSMSSSKQREKQKTKLDLAGFAKNFDVKLDERERMRILNSNLGAFGFDRTGDGDHGDDSGAEYELEHSVCSANQQVLFSTWSFNVWAPEMSPLGLREDPYTQEEDRLPKFALLQSVSALQTPDQVRAFVARTDDETLLELIKEMKQVHESLLAENAKFIQAEMRCDDLSRELARERSIRASPTRGAGSNQAGNGATRAEAVEFVEEEEISEI